MLDHPLGPFCILKVITKLRIPFTPAPGSDYVDVSTQVTFPSGTTTNGDTECLSIVIIDDNDFEEDQNFQVQIGMITPSIASGTGSALVTIQDNNGNFYS